MGGHAGTRQRRAPVVTISRDRRIVLNVGAFRLLGEPRAVTYLWDDKVRVVGLCPAPEEDDTAYRLTSQGRRPGSPRASGAQAFLAWARVPAGVWKFSARLLDSALVFGPLPGVPSPEAES